jgi:hypothetical protein
MTISKYRQLTNKNRRRSWLNFLDRVMAILALINLLLVLFDLSYIPLRDFWLQGRIQLFIKIGPLKEQIPKEPIKVPTFNIANYYDIIKGIEPYRATKNYLKRVDDLNIKINEIVARGSTQEETIEDILKDLRDRSVDMIDTNPFQIANKTGTLERIKNKMRDHIFGKEDVSSEEAFKIFWSQEHLFGKKRLREELNFFDREIRPLIETNYQRPVGENGEFVDNFGLIDFPFFILFATDFLLRTWWISRRHVGVSWIDAMLWRWYDIFLLIPVFRWLRVIPVIVRFNESGLLNLNAVKKQASQGFVASIAEDLTEVIFVRVINQIQGLIRQGEISNFLSEQNIRQYIDINGTNETAEIGKLIARVLVYQVLPKLRPDIEALLRYSIEKFIHQAPAYQRIQKFPGIEQLQTNLTQQIVAQIYQILSNTLNTFLEEDPVFNQLLERLIANFNKNMGSEIQAKQSLEKMESLLLDLLEEIKINYIERLSQENVEEILEQTRALRQSASRNS